jgi:hypothetical protein
LQDKERLFILLSCKKINWARLRYVVSFSRQKEGNNAGIKRMATKTQAFPQGQQAASGTCTQGQFKGQER